MNKYSRGLVLLVAALLLAWILQPMFFQTKSVQRSHDAIVLSAGSITCSYPQVLHVSYEANKIKHDLPKPETNPIIMTFNDLESNTPKVKFIDATQTISEQSLVKIGDTNEKIILVEGTGEPYLTVHTIYKQKGVATYQKSMSLVGIPVGTISMGSCINS